MDTDIIEVTTTKPYCKKCEQACDDNRQHKCLTCQSTLFWTCAICDKEMLAQSGYDHRSHCTPEKLEKRKMAKLRLAEEKKKWRKAYPAQSSSRKTESGNGSNSDNDSPMVGNESFTTLKIENTSGSSPSPSVSPTNLEVDASNKTTPGITVKAVYPYNALRKDELSFIEGDIIHVIQENSNGWWTGYLPRTNMKGPFPRNYVKIVSPEEDSANVNSTSVNKRRPEITEEDIMDYTSYQNSKNKQSIIHLNNNSTLTESMNEETKKAFNDLQEELEYYKLKCHQLTLKVSKLQQEKRNSLNELTLMKSLLESSLKFKASAEEEALEGLARLRQ